MEDKQKLIPIKNRQPYDTARMLLDLAHNEQLHVVSKLPLDTAAEVLEYLDPEIQYQILHHLDPSIAAPLLNKVSSDVIVDMFLAIHPLQAETLLQLIPEDYRIKINSLMTYPEDTAGSLMTVDYISARAYWTIQQTIDHIRKVGHEAETISYMYVINTRGELVGVASLRQIIVSDPKIPLGQIASTDVISVPAELEQEEVASILSRYQFYALPVVDTQNRLIGIITYDDVAEVIQEEVTEDFQKLGGSQPLDQDYFKTSAFNLFKKRIVWLLILFAGGAYTAKILRGYHDALAIYPVLAIFIPLLTGTGGNIGSQIVSTLVRALSVGEIKFKNIFLKEFSNSILIALSLAGAGFLLALNHSGIKMGTIVALATFSIVLWTTCVSTVLPVVLYHIKADPAVISGPLITTIVDGTALIIYFTIARLLLS